MTKADEFIQRAKSWDDFAVGQRTQADKEKGDSFERLVQLYLQLEPLYTAQLKNVWLLKEVPLEIRKKLNLRERLRAHLVMRGNSRENLVYRHPKNGISFVGVNFRIKGFYLLIFPLTQIVIIHTKVGWIGVIG
jgi:hypothetical protein